MVEMIEANQVADIQVLDGTGKRSKNPPPCAAAVTPVSGMVQMIEANQVAEVQVLGGTGKRSKSP